METGQNEIVRKMEIARNERVKEQFYQSETMDCVIRFKYLNHHRKKKTHKQTKKKKTTLFYPLSRIQLLDLLLSVFAFPATLKAIFDHQKHIFPTLPLHAINPKTFFRRYSQNK